MDIFVTVSKKQPKIESYTEKKRVESHRQCLTAIVEPLDSLCQKPAAISTCQLNKSVNTTTTTSPPKSL